MNDIFGYPVKHTKINLPTATGGYLLMDDWSRWVTHEINHKGEGSMPIRIGLTGPDRVGKSTTARHLVDHFGNKLFAKRRNAVLYSMAIPVYNKAAHLLGVAVEVIKNNKYTRLRDLPGTTWGNYDGSFVNMLVRDLLRGIGNGARQTIHEDIWVQYMLRRTNTPEFSNCVLFFDDIRYDNEARYLDMVFSLRRHGVDYSYHQADSPISEHMLSAYCRIDDSQSFSQMTDFIEFYLEKRGVL